MNNELFIALDTEVKAEFSVKVLVSEESNPKKLIRDVAEINGYSSKVPQWVN